MKTIITALLLCISNIAFAQSSKRTIEVKIEIENVNSNNGYWMLAIYDKESEFLSMKPFNAKRQKVGECNNMVSIDLPKGKYAIAVFQDLDDSKNLERNERGIPTEPYSFSGENVFPLKGMPTFENCMIKINKRSRNFKLALQNQ